MGPSDDDDLNALVELNLKYHNRLLQLNLLELVSTNQPLYTSKILPSVQPKVGKEYTYQDLEKNKCLILTKARIDLLQLSITEAERDISKIKSDITKSESNVLLQNDNTPPEAIQLQINKHLNPEITKINKKMKKKICYFSGDDTVIVAPQLHLKKTSTKRRKRKSKKQRKQSNYNNRQNNKKRKAEALADRVASIKSNKLVINLSQIDLPDLCYLYLSKGLNFVESASVDEHDLLFDTQDFIRKLEWKAFYKENPQLNTNEIYTEDIHKHLRVSGSSHPNFSHALLDNIKTKLLGWVANLKPSKPKSNLTPQETRGRKLLLDLINKEKVFITKADKGGATLIMNYDTVVNTIVAEVSDNCKYTKLDCTIDQALAITRKRIIDTVLNQEERRNITQRDKTNITGLNANNNMKHNPEFRAVPPKIWPLFKIHKLTEEQINQKTIPPPRFINAAKQGPLYRLGQWSSPYLTNISRAYCEEEFILDTPDLLSHINEFNSKDNSSPGNLLLATLDVEALYPSIDTALALQAMKAAFTVDTTTNDGIKEALLSFTELSFEQSYVTFRGHCYKSKKGIPTGGCDSRQIADLFLHWLIFYNLKDSIQLWDLIEFFKRFIDDVFLVWKGLNANSVYL